MICHDVCIMIISDEKVMSYCKRKPMLPFEVIEWEYHLKDVNNLSTLVSTEEVLTDVIVSAFGPCISKTNMYQLETI